MKLPGENRSTLRKTCPSPTNPTWTDPGSNLGLRGGRPAANRLSHGTALVYSFQILQNMLIVVGILLLLLLLLLLLYSILTLAFYPWYLRTNGDSHCSGLRFQTAALSVLCVTL
jgi:hypothetical protein